MDKTYRYQIKLLSDAEPASGFGSEILNSLLPRNAEGRLVIPATHLKGLMYENLSNILQLRADGEVLCNKLFGEVGEEGGGGRPGVLHLSDAVAEEGAGTLTITRTRLENGRAADKSLRANEALPKGMVLKGSFSCGNANETVVKLAALALLSISAVGGGRTRGAGACRVTIEEMDKATPGALLRELATSPVEFPEAKITYTKTKEVGTEVKALRLEFSANAPLCLPEHPVGQSNVITSGYAIAGTAVMGTLLTILSERDAELSSACLRSPVFRCYPLLPIPEDDEKGCIPLLVSNTHRISKLPQSEQLDYLFGDTMIHDEDLEPEYRWQESAEHISMKGASGMLIVRGKDAPIELLRDKEIPRFYSAHGVVNGLGDKRDNLYTMESVSVKRFAGIVILPSEVADQLLEVLKDGHLVSFGKAKTTQGNGMLTATEWHGFDVIDTEFPQVKSLRNRLFIVQTPIVYDAKPNESTKKILEDVLLKDGWGEVERESVMTGVLFGWNRLKQDTQIGETEQVQAKRVILPGSVFLLKEPVKGLREKLAAGLGSEKRGGYGAVMPHPMFARKQCQLSKRTGLRHFDKCGESPVFCGYKLHKQSEGLLSASQIARLMRAVQVSNGEALAFLERQRTDRPDRLWDKWKGVKGMLDDYLMHYTQVQMEEMLRVWHDLTIER